MDLVLDALLDALVDSAKMVPLLFVIYVLIEVLEVKLGDRLGTGIARAGKAGPLVGALAGIIPQCGISVMAAALYTQRFATVGTLFAVLLATSDEAIPVILSQPDSASLLVPLIATKLAVAVVVGYALDLVFRRRNARLMDEAMAAACATPAAPAPAGPAAPTVAAAPNPSSLAWSENPADLAGNAGSPATAPSPAIPSVTCGCCACGDPSCTDGAVGPRRLTARGLLLYPLKHTLQIWVFILLTSFVIALVFELVGQDAIAEALRGHTVLQPVLAALVGLIPNCAASVAVTEFYLEGVITFGATIAGLCAGGGLGVLVLAKEGRHAEAAAVIAGLFAVSVLAGIVVQALGVAA